MQVLIAISGFCPRIVNVPCTTPFDFLFIISIHVPAWGTTLTSILLPMTDTFQSTFPRGERPALFASYISWSYFNPRSRVGNDYVDLVVLKQTMFISIHVPAWGTTIKAAYLNNLVVSFQSTFPRGERPSEECRLIPPCIFQSTFPRGERRRSLDISESSGKFQSTFPRGERRWMAPKHRFCS